MIRYGKVDNSRRGRDQVFGCDVARLRLQLDVAYETKLFIYRPLYVYAQPVFRRHQRAGYNLSPRLSTSWAAVPEAYQAAARLSRGGLDGMLLRSL